MLEDIKTRVYLANIELVKQGLVLYTWGNASEVDRENNLVVIKPSGVSYDKMYPEDMVVVDLITGKKIEGKLNPSSDTFTHLELYRNFKEIGGISHTHSVNAVAFAQAGKEIVAQNTTHADYFFGNIPCTRCLKKQEVEKDYELNTGKVIVETLKGNKHNVMDIPGILVGCHGPFTWGKDAQQSVYHAVVLETIAEMNLKAKLLQSELIMPQYILDKHYFRKHGESAYYGQKDNKV